MTAKKSAKKTTASPADPSVEAPAAKKAAKKTVKKAAKKAASSSLPATQAPAPEKKNSAAPATAVTPELNLTPMKSPAKPAVQPTPDLVARAAYLNYRRRVELGLPGDSHSDWLEAERQLGVTW